MNLQYLRYALEVENTSSITKAAQNLFMSQPNLSKAIKELENEMQISIFKRTARGVEPTKKGVEFLNYAKTIISQIDEFESLYKPQKNDSFTFHLSVPRASYITYAFADFFNTLNTEQHLQIYFKETDSLTAIHDVQNRISDLAVIRYQTIYESYFLSTLEDTGLDYQLLWEFPHLIVLSKDHPLASQESISYHELSGYIEIVHGDLQVPSLSFSHIKKNAEMEAPLKRIYIYERGSQFDFLQKIPGTFMWVSIIPQDILDQHNLVLKRCDIAKNDNKDLIIYRKKHLFKPHEKAFIHILQQQRDYLQQKMEHLK
jgi:DNA-binding transcriptional LysR family regulator